MNRILSTALQATNDLKYAAVTTRDNLTAFGGAAVKIASKSYVFAASTVVSLTPKSTRLTRRNIGEPPP